MSLPSTRFQPGLDQLSGPHAVQSRVPSQNFLRHSHSHCVVPLSVGGFYNFVDTVDIGPDRGFDNIGGKARAV